MNDLGYSADKILKKEVVFPKEEAPREQYVAAVANTVKKLDQVSLAQMKSFDTAVKEQVGEKRIIKAQRRCEHLSTRFYLWILSHPKWELFIKIITFGTAILVANNGKTNYEKSKTFLPLVSSLKTLESEIVTRSNQMDSIKRVIENSLYSREGFRPESWIKDFEVLDWNGLDKSFSRSLQDKLISRSARDLSDPTTFTNEQKYKAIAQIYERLDLGKELKNLTQTKAVYTEAEKWNEKPFDQQMNLLGKMKQNSKAFDPILQTRIQELRQALSWDSIASLPSEKRGNVLKQARFLMEIKPFGSILKNDYMSLCAHVEKDVIPKCSWSAEETRKLEGICKDLELDQEFDLAHCLHRLTWKGISTLSTEERRNIIDKASFLMGDTFTSETIEKAFSDLNEDIRQRVLKQCWNNPETNLVHLGEICTDLGLSPQFIVASEASRLDALWPDVSYDEFLANTEAIVKEDKYYTQELEKRRTQIFEMAKAPETLNFQTWKFVVKMLQALQPVYQSGCSIEIKRIKERLLSSMMDPEARADEAKFEDFAQKGAILGLDPSIVEDRRGGVISSFWNFLKTGMLAEQRIGQKVHHNLRDERIQLRRIGQATEIVRLPEPDELESLTFVTDHIHTVVPSVPEFKGKADIMQLMNYLKEADRQGLIAPILHVPRSDGGNDAFSKKKVLGDLGDLLNSIKNNYRPNDRIARIKNILMLYVDKLPERFKACKNEKEKRELYVEIVELIGKEMGFSVHGCEDRKYNAAMMIYNEKIAGASLDDNATDKKLLVWAAKKRDELVSVMLHEMIHEAMQKHGRVYDIASSIGAMRYKYKDLLGLGDVPQSQYKAFEVKESVILKRFNQTYTPQWLLAKAMEEHKLENGNKALKISAMNDFLASRLSNYQDLQYDLLDEESYELLDRGMALYLQEVGIFEPLV